MGIFALAVTYGSACPYVPELATTISFAGQAIWDKGAEVRSDRLGTNRANGAKFYPYGEEISSTTNDRIKFGTYTRDGFTGLDYADQRYYAASYGRFNTADPYQASGGPSDPASWNRYSYTSGDPINRSDPKGLMFCAAEFESCDGDVTSFVSGISNSPGCPGFLAGMGFVSISGPGCYAPAAIALLMAFSPAAESPEPECFAQLKTRAVDDPRAELIGATHSFWYVQDKSGTQSIISEGPDTATGKYLDVWVNTDTKGAVDNMTSSTSWSSGLSAANCDKVARLLSAARSFPVDKVEYNFWSGPNSNSAAHALGVLGGFTPSRPDGAIAWDTAFKW